MLQRRFAKTGAYFPDWNRKRDYKIYHVKNQKVVDGATLGK